jgi:hypothetical protein
VRYAEEIELLRDIVDDAVDLGVGTGAGDVDGPGGQDVAEAVELSGYTQDADDLRVGRGRPTMFECRPEPFAVTLEPGAVLPECPLGAAHEIEEVVDALRLRLRVPNQRGAQAPVVRARTFGEVDQASESWRIGVGRHFQRLPTGGRRPVVRVPRRDPIADELQRTGDEVVVVEAVIELVLDLVTERAQA